MSRTDLYGVDRRTVTNVPRYDVTATIRRACARRGRLRVGAVLVGVLALLGCVATLRGLQTDVLFYTLAALAAVGVYTAPERVFERPDPVTTVGYIRSDGMTERAAMRRFEIHTQREAVRAERLQDERKTAERTARSFGRYR